MFVLIRALTWSTLFIGLVLIFVPARVLSMAGVASPASLGVAQLAGMVVGAAGPGAARRSAGAATQTNLANLFEGVSKFCKPMARGEASTVMPLRAPRWAMPMERTAGDQGQGRGCLDHGRLVTGETAQVN